MKVIIKRSIVIPRGILTDMLESDEECLLLSRHSCYRLGLTDLVQTYRGNLVEVPVIAQGLFWRYSNVGFDPSSLLMLEHAASFRADPDQLGLVLMAENGIEYLSYIE